LQIQMNAKMYKSESIKTFARLLFYCTNAPSGLRDMFKLANQMQISKLDTVGLVVLSFSNV